MYIIVNGVGQPVMVGNLHHGESWISGVIILKQPGPVSCLVHVGKGRALKHHVNHLKAHDLPEPECATCQDEYGTNFHSCSGYT